MRVINIFIMACLLIGFVNINAMNRGYQVYEDQLKESYQALELDQDVDIQAVRSKYKKLALKLHPDRNPNKVAEEEFKKISYAHQVLVELESSQPLKFEQCRNFQKKLKNRKIIARMQQSINDNRSYFPEGCSIPSEDESYEAIVDQCDKVQERISIALKMKDFHKELKDRQEKIVIREINNFQLSFIEDINHILEQFSEGITLEELNLQFIFRAGKSVEDVKFYLEQIARDLTNFIHHEIKVMIELNAQYIDDDFLFEFSSFQEAFLKYNEIKEVIKKSKEVKEAIKDRKIKDVIGLHNKNYDSYFKLEGIREEIYNFKVKAMKSWFRYYKGLDRKLNDDYNFLKFYLNQKTDPKVFMYEKDLDRKLNDDYNFLKFYLNQKTDPKVFMYENEDTEFLKIKTPSEINNRLRCEEITYDYLTKRIDEDQKKLQKAKMAFYSKMSMEMSMDLCLLSTLYDPSFKGISFIVFAVSAVGVIISSVVRYRYLKDLKEQS